MKENELELSNYWDDFQIRVNETIDAMEENKFPPLQRLTVHLTESCNMNCNYCNFKFDKYEMPFELAKKIVDDFVDMNGRIIHFTGGEPTVVSYFEELCKYSKEQGLTVSSNTNALKKISTKYIDKLKLSFDTPIPEEFNKIVGSNCFDKVVQNIKEYSEEMKDKMLSITAVLNKNTYKDMLELAQFVDKEFDVYNLYFSNYKGCNSDFAFEDDMIDDMFENYIPKTMKFFNESGNEYSERQLSLYRFHDFVNKEERFEVNKEVPCTIQLSELTIDIKGGIHNCSHLYRDFVKPAVEINVKDTHLKDAFLKSKESLEGKYTCIDKKCLSGCNTNLIGFNRTVQSKQKI